MCGTKYPSIGEMVKDDNIEVVFVTTDASSHADTSLWRSNTVNMSPVLFWSAERVLKMPTVFTKSSKRQT
jgi:hypothetical protein